MPTRPPARPGRRELVAETHAKAFAELRKAEVTPKWRSIGPDTIAGVNGSNASGHVSAIAIDPSDHLHLLVAGSGGGTWESRDAGASWTPRGDDQATTSIGALAFDPTNSSIVYCATGDAPGRGYLGVGLLRSTDGGRTWHTLCTAPFNGIGFFDLKVLPGGHLFAGTTNGLYVSADGGVDLAAAAHEGDVVAGGGLGPEDRSCWRAARTGCSSPPTAATIGPRSPAQPRRDLARGRGDRSI